MADLIPSKRPMLLGRGGFEFDFESAQRFAQALISGEMVPKGIKSPGAVLGIMQAGKELGLPPMYALSNLTFTNGRLGIMGDAAKALIRAAGVLKPGTDFCETFSGKEFTPEWKATVTAHRDGQPEPFVSEFSLADAIRAKLIQLKDGKVLTFKRDGGWGEHSSPWTTFTGRMLKYRALGFLVRDNFSDVIGGLVTTEELRDYPIDVAGVNAAIEPPTEPDPLLASAPVAEAEVVTETKTETFAASDEDREMGEALERSLAAESLAKSFSMMNTIVAVEKAWTASAGLRETLDPETLDELTLAYEARIGDLKGH